MTPARRRWGTERLRFLNEAVAVFSKEWVTEWRTRVALSSTALFALGALTLIALSLRVGAGAAADEPIVAAFVWLILLFTAATGLGRAYVQEEERGTSLALRLTARATTVWTGKFAANLALLVALSAISTPILLLILPVKQSNPGLLFCVLMLGDIGIAAVFTMMSALVAQASAKGGLLAALAFPLLVPLLMAGVHGTQEAFGVGANGRSIRFVSGAGDLQVLASYAVVSVTASLLLIDFLWSD